MKPSHLLAGISTTLIVSTMAGLALNAGFAMAQSDASSSTTTLPADTTPPADATTPASSPTPEAAPAPIALSLVHVVGTKYIDYCTDGTKVTAYSGDPEVDANFDKPDAPTPKCPDGMKWDHTSGMDKFDTATGDLDVGSYAQQRDGTFIIHFPASTYKDATSTSEWPDRFVTSQESPVAAEPTPSPAPAMANDASTSADATSAH